MPNSPGDAFKIQLPNPSRTDSKEWLIVCAFADAQQEVLALRGFHAAFMQQVGVHRCCTMTLHALKTNGPILFC